MNYPMLFTYQPVGSLKFQFYAKILVVAESSGFLGAGAK